MSGPTQPQSGALRILWLADGRPYVASEPVARTTSTCASTGAQYEHETAVRTSRALRPATKDEVREWRAQR